MSKTTTHLGWAKHDLLRILTVLLMFVAIPLQIWGINVIVEKYQGVELTKPKEANGYYLIYNRNELLWWAANSRNVNIKLMADINVQGDKQLFSADGSYIDINQHDILV